MNTELYNEEIDRFVKGELPPNEAEEIRQKMSQDPELKRLVGMHQLMHEGIQFTIDKDIERNLAAPAKLRQLRPKSSLKAKLAIAASIVIIAVVGWQLLPPFDRMEQLEDPLNDTIEVNLGIAGEGDKDLFAGQEAFNKQEWNTASAAFHRYLENAPDMNYEVLLYQGIAFRQAKEFAKATTIFEDLIFTEEQHYAGDEARWQLALIHLEQEEYEACRQLLNVLITDGGAAKKEKAQHLLKLLKGK